MKNAEYLIFSLSLLLPVCLIAQTAKIKRLASGYTIGSYSVVLHNIERDLNVSLPGFRYRSTFVRFVARKLWQSKSRFPFSTIHLYDDHGNEYVANDIFGWLSNDFIDFLQNAPSGLTFLFDAAFDIPETVPLDRFVRVKMFNGKILSGAIDLSRVSLLRLNIETELSWNFIQGGKFITSKDKINYEKYLLWGFTEVGNRYDSIKLNDGSVSNRQWVLPFLIENKDYVEKSISLRLFFQLPNGIITPYNDQWQKYSTPDRGSGIFELAEDGRAGVLDIWQIEPDSSNIHNYIFPIIEDEKPIRIFIQHNSIGYGGVQEKVFIIEMED